MSMPGRFDGPEDWHDDADTSGPACPVCRDSGIVVSADPVDGSPYESACPEPAHDDARDIGAQRAAELFANAADENWLGF